MEKKQYSQTVVTACLIAFILILGYTACKGQSDPVLHFPETAPTKYNWEHSLKRAILPGSLALLSGAAGGLREGLHFRRAEFFRAFPKANRNYWDTNISSEMQPKFFGAARDGYHDAQYVHTGLLFASGASAGIIVAVPLIRKEKRPWCHVLTDIGIQGGASLAGYFLGSRIVYDVILHK